MKNEISDYLRMIDDADNAHSPTSRAAYADALIDVLRDIFTDEEIQALAQAKADGRLVALPCKVGDTVFTTRWWDDVKEKCTDSKGKPFFRTIRKHKVTKEVFSPFGLDYIEWGKTVFLTREAAEKALSPICNTTKLPCAGCNPVCEHRAKS